MNDAVSLYAALAVCAVLSLVFLIFGLKVGTLLGRLRTERRLTGWYATNGGTR